MDLDENLFNLWRRAVIKSRGPGTSPGYYECGSRLLLLENRRKLEPKETPKCSIPRLLVVFTRQLEILATTLYNVVSYEACSKIIETICICCLGQGFQVQAYSHWKQDSSFGTLLQDQESFASKLEIVRTTPCYGVT